MNLNLICEPNLDIDPESGGSDLQIAGIVQSDAEGSDNGENPEGLNVAVWKEQFMHLFSEAAPSCDQCEELFGEVIGKECDLRQAIHAMDLDPDVVIDQNVYTALGVYFSSDAMPLDDIIVLCTAICSECNRRRRTSQFLSSSGPLLSPRCQLCRREQAVAHPMDVIYYIINVDDLQKREKDASRLLQKVVDMHYQNFEASRRSGCGYEGYVWSKNFCLPTLTSYDGDLNSLFEVRMSSQKQFVDLVGAREFYGYSSNGGTVTRAQYRCRQATRYSEEVHHRTVVRDRQALYQCGGGMVFSYKSNKMSIRLRHRTHHPSLRQRPKLDEKSKRRITELAEIGMAPFQVLSVVRAESTSLIVYDDVYHAWAEALSSSFRRHTDPVESVKRYVRESDTVKFIYEQTRPDGIGFATSLGSQLVKDFRVEEVLIDSTYKTNKQKMELFAVIASSMGAGFPIAYFLLAPGTCGDLKPREQSLSFFLAHVREYFPTLRPSFFFTDKEPAQINSIISQFQITPSLCLWHMKRAIKRKVTSLRRDTTVVNDLDANGEKELLSLIDLHYFRSSVFIGSSPEHLYARALDEVRSFFATRQNVHLQEYMMTCWYDTANWNLWGRRHDRKVSITRTTMKVEAHWSLLKRLFLMKFNRPRVDLLVHIVGTRLLVKVHNDYDAMKNGLKKPSWWKSFVKTWKKCREASTSVTSYNTRRDLFVCSCPQWQKGLFFLCKHLVQNDPCPFYNQVTINRSPPFLLIDTASTRVRANIDSEDRADLSIPLQEQDVDMGPIHVPNSYVDGEETSTVEDAYEDIRDLLRWSIEHVDDLHRSSAGDSQLQFINRNVLRGLRKYKTDVLLSQNARHADRTWHNANTTSLP